MPYVMLAIPSELLPAVTEFIEAHQSEGERSSPNEPETFLHGWTPETVQRAYRDSADNMRSVLRFLADHPGEEVSSERIARAIDARFGWNTVAGMLGAFGRRSANRYRVEGPMWHFRPGNDGRVLLTMPAAVAEVVEHVAKEDD